MTKRLGRTAVALLVAVSLLSSGCTARRLEPGNGPDARAVLEAFKSRDLGDHLEALQRIADDNGWKPSVGDVRV